MELILYLHPIEWIMIVQEDVCYDPASGASPRRHA